jgi:hypothetical protein
MSLKLPVLVMKTIKKKWPFSPARVQAEESDAVPVKMSQYILLTVALSRKFTVLIKQR